MTNDMTNLILRIKEQETRLTLQEQDDDDDDYEDELSKITSTSIKLRSGLLKPFVVTQYNSSRCV